MEAGYLKPLKARLVDEYTLLVFLLQVAGAVVCFWGLNAQIISWPVCLILACICMNLSFTVWHECSHGNFSRARKINEIVGIISSFASLYPGYFARRREHLAHHRFEGDPSADPVFPRIQTSLIGFFPGLVVLLLNRENGLRPNFMPLSSAQRWIDRITVLGALTLCVLLVSAGYLAEIVLVFLLPRAVIFLLHAFYICYLPHAKPEGGFEPYRIVSVRPLAFLLTMGQSIHGVHHRWPAVPWHQYGKYISSMSAQEKNL